MIPYIRGLHELMAITKSRDSQKFFRRNETDNWPDDSGQHKRYIKSLRETKIELPDLPKSVRHKWLNKKEKLYSFIEELDYSIQIQPSYELTMQEKQNNYIYKDVA